MELWDLYDRDGNITGETWERVAGRNNKIPDGRYHMVCEILVRHSDGTFLLTKRHPEKDLYPGFWEATCGGSAVKGEDPITSARRELLEETGIKADDFYLVEHSFSDRSHSMYYSFLTIVDCDKDSIVLQENETVDYRWVDNKGLLEHIDSDLSIKTREERFSCYTDAFRVSDLNGEIRTVLFSSQDLDYRKLQKKTIPNLDIEAIIGVRTPILRNLAKQFAKADDIDKFLNDVPHRFFDEDQLHAFIISGMKDYDKCVCELNKFLPYVNNWATCDQMSPKIFGKHHKELTGEIKKWLKSDKTYTIRFGIGMLMEHFLKEDFNIKYAETVAKIRSDEYYINMMIAWYFATALAFQYDSILPFIENNKLDKWTHNKTIQKAIESYRITDDQKTYLRSLKIK